MGDYCGDIYDDGAYIVFLILILLLLGTSDCN